ncbi:SDR family NAD(P)-dependent oxidoreductase [Novosphingobium sp. BL-52-GroH]|uniref:SDR family NAD(P)-dependent oxidoreductase n=1 Tax=Novosphingobium sp. BL-52-GroH TaxID=3349877 RepID=UPI00384D280B
MSAGTILIVGAGPGLGLSIARTFGREGFGVALVGRSPERLGQLVARLVEDGIEAAGFVADATDRDALTEAIAAAKVRFGPIDVLEYSPIAPAADPASLAATVLTAEVAEQAIGLLALGAVASVQAVLPDMLRQGSGTILITTGGSAIQHQPFLAAFSMGGGAARNYALTLHAALAGTGVYAASVCIALGIRKGDPEGDPDLLATRYLALHKAREQAELQILARSQLEDLREFADRSG